MAITTLSDSLINKIAAGEVIERPANVIKELIENAIDAQANEIKIEIEESGLKRIKIADNGSGMDRDDLSIACKRHTTSKIASEEDLFEINSLGFRGEALASIAEVSHISIKSKQEDNEVGNLIEIEGGILLKAQRVGSPNGTIIEISNLFYNVPARKKFLKSPEVELAHIIDIVTRYALIKKNIAINLTHNGKEIINSQKTDDDLNNIIYIYGTEIAKDLVPVNYKTGIIEIKGYVSKPSLTRANKNEQSVYINERYVKSTMLTNAIYEAYKTMLFTNRHPIFILNITLNPGEVDVNIHPNKLDIRLKNEEEITSHVQVAVKEALESQSLMHEVTPDNQTTRKPAKEYEFSKETQSNLFSNNSQSEEEFKYTIENITHKNQEKNIIRETAEEIAYEYTQSTSNKFIDFKILGQINKTFIICENREGLVIIDQHAAEERVNYEKFVKEKKDNAIKKQTLLEQKVIDLNPLQFQTAMNNKDILYNLGFEFSEFGGTTIKQSTIPEVFGRLKQNLFIDIINELSKVSTSILEQEIEDRIIRFACKASIKAGDELTHHQMTELIKKLGETENPYTCPHGRPTIIQITNADLEKKFKRTGW